MIRSRGRWLMAGMLLLLLSIAGVARGLLPEELQERAGSFEEACKAKCPRLDPEKGEADDAGTEVGCGVRCRVDHCSDGCVVWEKALNTSCQEVCNATQRLLSIKELYCTIGCQNALSQYFQQLKVEIGVPPTPVLVEDSLASRSLTLRWDDARLKKYGYKLLYFAQWKYADVEGEWRYCDKQNWNGVNKIFIHELQPYTKYTFRLAILLSLVQKNDEPLLSAASLPVLTFASGPPTSAPVIVNAMAIDHSRVYVNWKAGLFTNGPLFSYVLRLKQASHEELQLKDIPVSQDTFMLQYLEPNTNYSVTLTMRNADGEGPATSAFVKTLVEPQVSLEKPYVIMCSEHLVVHQQAAGLSDTVFLHQNDDRIRDTALHVARSQLFLSDEADRLYRVDFAGAGNATTTLLLEPNSTQLRPWMLSVDWLNSRLYISGTDNETELWQLTSCDYEGKDVRKVVTGLTSQPRRLEVDPVNGYLFWTTNDGIYRVELGGIEGDGEPVPEQIKMKQHLGAFIVDYTTRRLLVAYQTENTIKSVSLDGQVVVDVRGNIIQQPRFEKVDSLSMMNGLFYWTNGDYILTENYGSNDESKYAPFVVFEKVEEDFLTVHVLTEDTQPTPPPTRPPTHLQALVLAERAWISWRKPELLSSQGPGAWRNWSYALSIEDDINGEVIQERELRGRSHVVDELRDHSLYTIKLAAYTAAGDGPWSSEFKVQTLKKELESSIIWSTNHSLLESDLIGENVRTLVNTTGFDKESPFFVTDVSWFKDLLFIVGNNSKLYQYNITSGNKHVVEYANSVTSVAVDWITGKIYWADQKKRIILRSNLNGTQQEPVVISGIVRKLLVDTLEANLYWATSRTVEVSRLNGEDRRSYRSEDDFDGRHVVGLTLDLENRFVYWAVGDREGDYRLYRSITADMLPVEPDILPELVSTIHSIIGISLSYISHRFLLLRSPSTALTTDAYGKYTANMTNITSPTTPLLSLTVKTPLPPAHPEIPNIFVRPEPVNASSIVIVGTWRDFNVTWQPCNATTYGRVFYEVAVADYFNVDAQPAVTMRTSIGYANADRLLPYTLVEVTVRAYTYWDTAPRVTRVLRSPQSVPSQPMEPRLFVESYKDPMAEHVDHFITFRWNMPEFVNGPVVGFTVQCWFVLDKAEVAICDSVNVPVTELEYQVHDLQPNTTYYFQVCAYADVGAGPYTDPISISTINENPVPRLLVATMEDVKKIDLDERTNLTITRHIAVEVAHLAAEAKIYWINEMQELVTADVDGKNITKMLTLNNTALSLCADWISRNLFWTEASYEDSGISHIMKMDITVWEAGVFKYSRILSRNRRIVNLDIAPLTGTLFWMELSTSNLGFVMQSNLDGGDVQPFFNHTEDCSCPFRPMIQPVFTIDNTEPQSPVVYWVGADGELYIADIEGCICSLVLGAGTEHGLPPTSLTTDKSNIYWSNMTTGKIHFADKTTNPEDLFVMDYPISDARSIRAIGKSLQPYPDSDCLMPQRAVYSVQQVTKTSTSITLRLPEPSAYLGCQRYNLPATLYTIDAAECKKSSSTEACLESDDRIRFRTYWREFEARGLKPFTEYRFKLTLNNYYSDKDYVDVDQYGPGLVLRTGAGVPTEPENLRVRSLTPKLAAIEWQAPREWNAEFVRYRVHWHSTRLVDGVRPEGEKSVRDGEVTAYLEPLLPGRQYLVHVRAYPENATDVYSESSEKLLEMLPEPGNLSLSAANSEAMNVSWAMPTSGDAIVNYTLEYTRSDLERWQFANDWGKVKDKVVWRIRDLKSKERYKFRLVLRYRNHAENFVWPEDGRFTFQTLEDIPTAPGTPTLVSQPDSKYALRWEPARSLGAQALLYFLEGTIIGDANGTTPAGWQQLYNGTLQSWEVRPSMHEKYAFRVRARNDHGYGNWSEVSAVVDLTDMTRAMVIAQEHLGLILGLAVPAVTIVLLCFCYFLCPFHKKAKEDQKKMPVKTKPNVELATLREIPRGNFVEANALYVAAVETDSDDSLLPKIQREQISIVKFLGSGAFGEVFQGIVKDIDGVSSRTPIAIKTLRKGASAQEKNEFLQEAKLMSHFQHKHVLRLMGVCLDTDPPLLLLELMAGGDLLSYLRTSRAMKPTDSAALKLQDLLSMCEDVARGCRYLEELHFVHRDLACRNCLVSARDRDKRVVKVGDFGLARDIYKNDYYRKEGEGLLPVRWMAPESLVDGVFTSQSDVWAFGVLMWEITSLGQQPYQARTNLEVLHHVRAGGRLPKPLNCPPRLHQLMLRCWSAVDSRPSFKVCLEHIIALRATTEDSTLSPVNPGQFLVHGNAYKSNHFKDNLSMQPLFQDSDSTKPAIRPKYSWLLDDSLESEESKDPRAAYEIPKSIPVVVENSSGTPNESRYIEVIGSNTATNSESTAEKEESAGKDDEDKEASSVETANADTPRWNNRTSVASLNVLEKRLNRSSTASLGDKLKSPPADGQLRQSGSYARLVGAGESVSSLSDWRRVKEEATTTLTRSARASPSISYSTVSFSPQQTFQQQQLGQTKLQRSKSSLQAVRANIPLVINSALLNVLSQEMGEEEAGDEEANYANIGRCAVDIENVTDL